MAVFFTSDLHFGHKNILNFSPNRYEQLNLPINATIEEHDKAMMKLWNNTVSKNDVVYVLGDMFFNCSFKDPEKILSGLKGKKHLILGNHDPNVKAHENLSKFFVTVSDIKTVSINCNYQNNIIPLKMILCHYPILSWDRKAHGYIHLHGHTHGNIDNYNDSQYDLRFDVGFDSKNSNGKFLTPEDIWSLTLKKMENNLGYYEDDTYSYIKRVQKDIIL